MSENNEILETKVDENEELEPAREIVFEEALEAILFAAGYPVSYATLAKVFNMTPTQTKNRVIDYAIKYNNSNEIVRGVNLLLYPDSCQLSTKQYYLPEIRAALGVKKTGSLSTSALETLAIVAYNQPTTRAFVDALRRVDSSYQMTSLVDRGLIECVGRLDAPGRPMLYGTTSAFLRCFGLAGLDALPETSEELIALFEKTKKEQEEEMMQQEAEQLSIDDLMDEGIHSVNVPDDAENDTAADKAQDSTEPEYDEAGVEDDISYE